MKKQSLLLITGGILAFASCNNDTAGTVDNSQARIDSMVNERVEMIRAELEAKNDSIINERALYLADSMMAVAAGKPVPAKKPTAAKPTTPTQQPAKEPTSARDRAEGASDQNKQSARDKAQGASDQNKQSARDRARGAADQN